jgi:hypothetical protein
VKITSATRLVVLKALSLIGLAGIAFAGHTAAKQQPDPPIGVHFRLDHPGFVTLVVENDPGTRARNLVSETYFSAGDQVAWWDGLDERLNSLSELDSLWTLKIPSSMNCLRTNVLCEALADHRHLWRNCDSCCKFLIITKCR